MANNPGSKLRTLHSIFQEMENVLVAFSGGVDSTYLLKAAKDVLGVNVLAVTADSESYPREELEEAKVLARQIGVEHLIIRTGELSNENYAINPVNRCFFCKDELFTHLQKIAGERNIPYIVYGEIADDVGDFRPGAQAAKKFGVRAPLREAGFTKEEIRALSREMGLPTHDKPAMACLSSRIAYGERITPEKLSQVEQAERFLHSLGFRQVRVRHHENTARIEFEKKDLPSLFSNGIHEKIVSELKRLGYIYVTVDLEGYRTGSMNEEIGNSQVAT